MFIMNVLFLVAGFQSYLFWWKFIDLDAFRKNLLPSQIFLSLIPLRLLPTQGRPQKKSISPLVWLCIFSACLVCTYLLSFVGDAINTLFSSLLGIPPVNQLASMTVQSPLWFNLLFLVILRSRK